MPPKFIYFDLGNVLLFFSNERAFRQISAVCGIPAETISEAMSDTGGLKWRLECGELNGDTFYECFCEMMGTRPDRAALELASSDIFEMNYSIVPVVAQLEAAGHRLGLLSNICEVHWRYLTAGQYGILPRAFEVKALSFQIGAMKPEPKIYQAATELAGVAPQEIFFFDDVPSHVTAARDAGFDAVQYTTTPALVAELRKRGVRFNY